MDDLGRFKRGRFLGRGASGNVYQGVETTTGARVAIKSVDARRFQSIAELEAAQAEIELLSSLRHRYIVRLLAVHISPVAIHFVMEHAAGGTMAQLLAGKEGRRLGEAEAQRIFLQIFQAVEYCHRRCVVHRDLKPENILLDAGGDVKVADFGLASILTPFDGDVCSAVGTPEFMAPDLLVTTSCDGAKADMWSLGVMLYESLAGHTPFGGPNLPAILRAALKGECQPLPAEVGADCRGLVAALLQPDPLRRITMEEVLRHLWVRSGLEQGRTLSLLPSFETSGEGGDEGEEPGAENSEQLGPEPSVWGRGAGRACRSSPGSLDISLNSQRSSLLLLLPGMEGAQGWETSGHLPGVPEEEAEGGGEGLASLRGGTAAAAAAAGKEAAGAAARGALSRRCRSSPPGVHSSGSSRGCLPRSGPPPKLTKSLSLSPSPLARAAAVLRSPGQPAPAMSRR